MTRSFWAGLVVIAAGVGLAGNLLAFSVGEIDVQSTANEPFRAEVPFVLEPHERDRELEVLLGTEQDYQLEELQRAPMLEHMHVILAPDKRDTIRIFSNVPVADEAFDLLVLVRSGKLTFVRNYHVELTEAAVPEAPQSAVVQPVVRQADADPIPSPEPVDPSPPPATPPTPTRVEAQADLSDLYGPIRRGETMYNIVSKLDVPKEQSWQAVVLLWSLNHGEFVRGNLHGLQVGAYLEIPADFAERLGGMDKEASQQVIHSQWQAWRRRLVTTVAQALDMTAELSVEEPPSAADTPVEPVDAQVPQPVVTVQADEAEIPPEEPAPDDSDALLVPQEPSLAVQVAEVAPPPEEPVPDDSAAAGCTPASGSTVHRRGVVFRQHAGVETAPGKSGKPPVAPFGPCAGTPGNGPVRESGGASSICCRIWKIVSPDELSRWCKGGCPRPRSRPHNRARRSCRPATLSLSLAYRYRPWLTC